MSHHLQRCDRATELLASRKIPLCHPEGPRDHNVSDEDVWQFTPLRHQILRPDDPFTHEPSIPPVTHSVHAITTVKQKVMKILEQDMSA